MSKPIKPNVTIPAEFAPNGVRTPFSNAKVQDGFDRINPDVFAGDNLNQFIDDTYKASNYALDLGDYVLGHDQIPPVMINAPNGVFTNSGNSITIKQRLRFTLPNGVNADGTLNNTEYEVAEDITQTILPSSNATFVLFFAPNEQEGNKIRYFSTSDYHIQDTEPFTPATGLYGIWFSRKDNKVRYSLNGSAWTDYLAIAIGTVKTDANGNVTNIYPYIPIRIPEVSMVDGPWVEKSIVLSTATTGNETINLSNYLPNDNYPYEVIGGVGIKGGSGTGVVMISTGHGDGSIGATGLIGVVQCNANEYARGQFLCCVGNDHLIGIKRQGAAFATCEVVANAYRRMGTNS